MFMFLINVTFRLVIQSPEVEKTSLYRGKMCRQDPTLGSLKRGFVISGFVISGLCAIQITVILPGPKSVLRYNGDFVISGFVIPGFHCILILLAKTDAAKLIKHTHFYDDVQRLSLW